MEQYEVKKKGRKSSEVDPNICNTLRLWKYKLS